MEEVEEVREVQSELYRRVSLSEHVSVTPVTDTLTGATDLVTLRPMLNCFDQSDEDLVYLVK